MLRCASISFLLYSQLYMNKFATFSILLLRFTGKIFNKNRIFYQRYTVCECEFCLIQSSEVLNSRVRKFWNSGIRIRNFRNFPQISESLDSRILESANFQLQIFSISEFLIPWSSPNCRIPEFPNFQISRFWSPWTFLKIPKFENFQIFGTSRIWISKGCSVENFHAFDLSLFPQFS